MQDDLSPLAQRLGRYLAEQCTDGQPDHFGDELLEVFADEDRKSLQAALAELKAEGFVDLTPVMGPFLPRIRTTVELFVACDAAITGHDPREDSVALAKLLIASPHSGSALALEQASGWDRRRFNPAFALLLRQIDDRRVRKTITADYPSLGVMPNDDDLVQLRRYVQRYA